MAKVRILSGSEPATLIEKNITANGTYNASADDADGYSSVNVNVSPILISKTITENGTYTAHSEPGAPDGYSTITVNVQSEVSMTPTTLFSGASIVGANTLSDDYTKYDFIEFEVATPSHTSDEGELILITADELQTILNANKSYLLSSWSNRYTMFKINGMTMTVSAQADQVITRVIGHKLVVS